MKHRELVPTLLLSLFVPFYLWYWLYDTAKGLRSRNVPGVPSFALLVAPLLTPLVGVLILTVIFIAGSAGGSKTSGVTGVLGVIFSLLIDLLIIVLTCLYYYRFSKAAGLLVGSDMSPGNMTLIFVLFAPLPVYFIQEKINYWLYADYMANNPSQAPQPPVPTPIS